MSQNLKGLFKGKDNRTIATVLMDICHSHFTEDNFNFYKYSLEIFFHLSRLKNDGIINEKQFDGINKELENLINECVVSMED